MLIDKLRLAITAQQHAEIVKPAHYPLKFNAVHQEDGERGAGFPDTVQKSVLQILFLVVRHSSDLIDRRPKLAATHSSNSSRPNAAAATF